MQYQYNKKERKNQEHKKRRIAADDCSSIQVSSIFKQCKKDTFKMHWFSNAFLFYIESFFKIIRRNCEQFVNISKKLKLFALQISIYNRMVFIDQQVK